MAADLIETKRQIVIEAHKFGRIKRPD